MSRAPFVVAKADSAFSRSMKMEDTTLGWRFINPSMKAKYGVDSMPETGENVAEEFHIGRKDQDLFALRSQQRAADAIRNCRLKQEIVAVPLPQTKGDPILFCGDEHPRPDTTLEALSKLKPVVKPNGTITAGNASGVNDGACALLLASEAALKRHGLTPRARVVAAAAAGVAPRIMGMGPVPATRKVHRAPPGRQRRAASDHCALSAFADQRQICAVHHVHRCGSGDCSDSRTRLASLGSTRFHYVAAPRAGVKFLRQRNSRDAGP